MGNILMWNTRITPSNLSSFPIFELDPLLSMQTTRCLHLHLLSENKEGKSLYKLKASQIQEIKVPRTFEEYLQALQFYLSITTILFDPCSALVIRISSIITAIQSKKIVFKTCIATNYKFPTKFLYAMEIHTKCWLGKCQKYLDCSMVIARLVFLTKILRWYSTAPSTWFFPPILSTISQKANTQTHPHSRGRWKAEE